ncbi:MAG: fumarylacetoacetate hydrolase family protein [Thermomicrobium sp.]|uniref:fumarylacetoacetate hydrolase family protein n=1 Tax=Thermomicrobium sp. TaxID=1969469 RepID=UPI001B1BA867|nr:fumarylacetoacetate hydrolase family protein [Thermomicrobium sp.]MBO9351917.1 fumarylacetoacetate hydrolase family protein [Thermomicrobium sp.]
MKLATFAVPSPAGPVRRIGALAEGWLVDLQAAYAAYLARTDPGCEAERLAALLIPDDMVAFLGHGQLGWQAAAQALEEGLRIEEAFGRRTRYQLGEVRLLTPVPRPRVIRDFLTFEGHMRNASRALGRGGEIPPAWYEVPAYYKGDPDTVVGPDADVVMPRYTQQFDFELELGMVIGRRGKDIPVEEAHRYIAGFTIFNDFSARDQQMREAPIGMGPSKGKDFDTGNAIGPYLVTPDELDVTNLRMVARVNGEVWSEGSSRGMHFSFAQLIAHVSQSETIYPGELWGSGTVTNGCGLELGRFLQPGDVVELEVEGIGILRNRVVRAVEG